MIDFHLIFLESTLGSPTCRHIESRPMQAQWQNDPTLVSTIVNDETADKATGWHHGHNAKWALIDDQSLIDHQSKWQRHQQYEAPDSRTEVKKTNLYSVALKASSDILSDFNTSFPPCSTKCVHNSGFPVTGTQCLLMTPHFLMFAFLLFDPPLEKPDSLTVGKPIAVSGGGHRHIGRPKIPGNPLSWFPYMSSLDGRWMSSLASPLSGPKRDQRTANKRLIWVVGRQSKTIKNSFSNRFSASGGN